LKLGKKRQILKWLNELKIAVIQEDITAISILIKELPEFNDLEKAKEALALVERAIEIVDLKKAETLKEMNKIKTIKEFVLNS